jgi:5-(carboxyamino)imidazole ribonucleotide synthase
MVTRLGIIGGGQLAMMMGLAAYPLGIIPSFYDPNNESPAFKIGTFHQNGFDNEGALLRFASSVDKITYEFENISSTSLSALNSLSICSPPLLALSISQDRFIEKKFLQTVGIPTADFLPVDSEQSLRHAVLQFKSDSFLKSRTLGYDGKGQIALAPHLDAELSPAICALLEAPCILEKKVFFERELSQIGVRDAKGNKVFYPLTQNYHEDGILRTSLAPAPDVPQALEKTARDMVATLMDELDYVGVLTLELFASQTGLIANEIAPRVHNSGHWTIEGAITSQFENHIRAVCNFPLGDCSPRGVSCMRNLLGVIPPIEALLSHQGVHVHIYHKSARPLRKVGHVTAQGASTMEVERIMWLVQDSLN